MAERSHDGRKIVVLHEGHFFYRQQAIEDGVQGRKRNCLRPNRAGLAPPLALPIRQIEHLTRIDTVWIADLAVIGLVDGGVFNAGTINAARNRPQIVAAPDDRLARGKTLVFGIADLDRHHSGHFALGSRG